MQRLIEKCAAKISLSLALRGRTIFSDTMLLQNTAIFRFLDVDWVYLKNTIASILHKNVLVYLSLDIFCSSTLTSFLIIIYFVSWTTISSIVIGLKTPICNLFTCQVVIGQFVIWRNDSIIFIERFNKPITFKFLV